jgi:hypothetical protein
MPEGDVRICRDAERRWEHGEFAKIFDTTDFGYREIRVERPLRLNLQATPNDWPGRGVAIEAGRAERDDLLTPSAFASEVFRIATSLKRHLARP